MVTESASISHVLPVQPAPFEVIGAPDRTPHPDFGRQLLLLAYFISEETEAQRGQETTEGTKLVTGWVGIRTRALTPGPKLLATLTLLPRTALERKPASAQR